MNAKITQTTKLTFDPAQFNDPLATRIDWSHLQKGEKGLKLRNLCETNPDRLEFKVVPSLKLHYLTYLFIGLAAILLPPFARIIAGNSIWTGWKMTLLPLLFGLLSTATGASMYYYGAAPIVFDKRIGYFFKGWKSPDHTLNNDSIKYFAEFVNIHALQIVSEPCTLLNRSYLRYELNIVLKNASRLHVVSLSKDDILNQDTKKLANFLNVPIWDATQ